MSVEPRDPAVCEVRTIWEARVNDKNTQQFAGPEKEPIHQGEGLTNLAFLGIVYPRLQEGDSSGSL